MLKLICDVMEAFLRRLNIPAQEIDDITDQILEKGVSMFFDSFQAYDVQAIRKESREEAWEEARREFQEEIQGYQKKIQVVQQDAEEQGILNTIRICRDLDISSDRILEQLMQKYQLTETVARKYMECS